LDLFKKTLSCLWGNPKVAGPKRIVNGIGCEKVLFSWKYGDSKATQKNTTAAVLVGIASDRTPMTCKMVLS